MKDIEAVMVDFYNGAHVLEVVATWAGTIVNRQKILEQAASFEKAYEHLVGLHVAGKLGAGPADFSSESLKRVKRLCRLLESALESETYQETEVQEIQALAGQCSRALARK